MSNSLRQENGPLPDGWQERSTAGRRGAAAHSSWCTHLSKVAVQSIGVQGGEVHAVVVALLPEERLAV